MKIRQFMVWVVVFSLLTTITVYSFLRLSITTVLKEPFFPIASAQDINGTINFTINQTFLMPNDIIIS